MQQHHDACEHDIIAINRNRGLEIRMAMANGNGEIIFVRVC
jgi:hypothetical protein